MDIQQRINLALFEEFQKRDIVFAYPTQTIYVSGAKPISVSLKGQPASEESE
jgi:small-conductance mechanosensitive channel